MTFSHPTRNQLHEKIRDSTQVDFLAKIGAQAQALSAQRAVVRGWCLKTSEKAKLSTQRRTEAVQMLMFAARRAQAVRWTRREALLACTTLAETANETWRSTRLPAMLEVGLASLPCACILVHPPPARSHSQSCRCLPLNWPWERPSTYNLRKHVVARDEGNFIQTE